MLALKTFKRFNYSINQVLLFDRLPNILTNALVFIEIAYLAEIGVFFFKTYMYFLC